MRNAGEPQFLTPSGFALSGTPWYPSVFVFLLWGKHLCMTFPPPFFFLLSPLISLHPPPFPPICPSWSRAGAGFYGLISTNFAHLFPSLYSLRSHWWVDISIGGSVSSMKIGGQYKERLFFRVFLGHLLQSLFRRTGHIVLLRPWSSHLPKCLPLQGAILIQTLSLLPGLL